MSLRCRWRNSGRLTLRAARPKITRAGCVRAPRRRGQPFVINSRPAAILFLLFFCFPRAWCAVVSQPSRGRCYFCHRRYCCCCSRNELWQGGECSRRAPTRSWRLPPRPWARSAALGHAGCIAVTQVGYLKTATLLLVSLTEFFLFLSGCRCVCDGVCLLPTAKSSRCDQVLSGRRREVG